VCAAPKAEEPASEPVRPASDRGFGDRDKRDPRDDKRDARDDKRDARDDKPVRDKPARGERTAQRGGGDDPLSDAPEVAASRGNPTLMYTGLATGVAGLVAAGVGIYAGVQGKQISDQLNSHDPMSPWPDNIKDLERRGEAYNRLQVISLIGGGVLITTGVVLFVVSRPDAPPERDRTAVRVVPTSNGLAVFGRF
ncbi:MAG TPA: hypothetical protein VIX73_34795, partial [Kofleriaceae bacterium]